MCVNSLAIVRVKECESECFRIDRGVRQGFIMPPLALQCVYAVRGENWHGEDGSRLGERKRVVKMTWAYMTSRSKT